MSDDYKGIGTPETFGGGEGGITYGMDSRLGAVNPNDYGYYSNLERNPYSNIFFYSGKGSGGGGASGHGGAAYWDIDPNLSNAVSWGGSKVIGNEGMTTEQGKYNIDWSKLPKGSTMYGANMAPAFSTAEEEQQFLKDPSSYWNRFDKSVVKKNPQLMQGLTPKYDPNYGWVVNSNAANQIAEQRYNDRALTKIDRFLVNTALPAAGSAFFGGLGMPSWASSAVNFGRGAASGNWKQAGINTLASLGGSYIGGQFGNPMLGKLASAGMNYGGSYFNRPQLSSLYPQTAVSPGNMRMNMGYMPPSSYNYLQNNPYYRGR